MNRPEPTITSSWSGLRVEAEIGNRHDSEVEPAQAPPDAVRRDRDEQADSATGNQLHGLLKHRGQGRPLPRSYPAAPSLRYESGRNVLSAVDIKGFRRSQAGLLSRRAPRRR